MHVDVVEETVAGGGEFVVVYSTWPDRAAAEAAARGLVDRHLAACVALLPGMVSLYRWQGAIERADEVVMLVKTRAACAAAVEAAIAEIHPYDVPALLVLPVLAVSAAYGAWLLAETAGG